jgi:prevent-host-death family protein
VPIPGFQLESDQPDQNHYADGVGETVNIYEAKAQLSRLVARAEAGEEITLTRHGRPVARLAPLARRPVDRVPGAWRGRVVIGEDFETFTRDDDADWYGR